MMSQDNTWKPKEIVIALLLKLERVFLVIKGLSMFQSDRSVAASLGILVAVFYSLSNIGFAGPAYLADEIGYLLNAAALSGSKIDASSSYHFGYPLFLIPSYVFFENIDLIWRSIQITNAALFGVSFSILYLLSDVLSPNATRTRRLTAVGICALGPPWLVMSGYAFSSPAFTLIFILAVWFLVNSDKKPMFYLCSHGLLVGFLYWVHPTGLAVAGASLLSLIYLGALKKEWIPILFSGMTIVLMVLTYRWMQPIFWSLTTPDGFAPDLHYPSITWDRVSFAYIWSAFVRATGQITYITVGTLGFGLVGCWMAMKMTFASTAIGSKFTGLFLLFSLVGLITIGSLMFSALGVSRTDHWIYGRYLAGALLPILLLGLLAVKTKGVAIFAFLTPAIFLLFSTITTEASFIGQVEPGWGINAVNTPAFWVVEVPWSYGFSVALMIGAVVSALALLLPKVLAQAMIVIVFLLGINQSFAWHSGILAGYSRPSSIPKIIKDNWPSDACVGLDPVELDHSKERMSLYKFHLHDYQVRRMHFFEWATGCDGPFITSNFDYLDHRSDVIVAMEIDTGLFLLSKREIEIVEPVFGVYPKGHICAANALCVARTARDLNHMSQVGALAGERLNSDGRSGFLFFGPYVNLPAGRYQIKIDAELFERDGGFIEVVAAPAGSFKITRVNLVDLIDNNFEFDLQHDAAQVEVRLFVTDRTKLSFGAYSIVNIPSKVESGNESKFPIVFDFESLHDPEILRRGWHASEENHVWSKSAASLNIPKPSNCSNNFCEVKLRFSVFGGGSQRPVSVFFASAEHDWAWSEKMDVVPGESKELTIPLVGANSWRRINILVPSAVSPRRVGVSSDERTLGVSLQRIELVQQ